MNVKEKCPLCGSYVSYRGLVVIECLGGSTCPNFRKTTRPAYAVEDLVGPRPEHGSREWAVFKHRSGYRVGWRGAITRTLHEANPHDAAFDDPNHRACKKNWELV